MSCQAFNILTGNTSIKVCIFNAHKMVLLVLEAFLEVHLRVFLAEVLDHGKVEAATERNIKQPQPPTAFKHTAMKNDVLLSYQG